MGLVIYHLAEACTQPLRLTFSRSPRKVKKEGGTGEGKVFVDVK
jgi:hypothetical protein